MKGKLLILLLGSMILFSDCNPFKNLGKTKQERKDERRSNRARKLVEKAVRISPEILHPDTITIPGTHIDSSVHVDTVINFVDGIIDRLIHDMDDSGGNGSGLTESDIEALKIWAIEALKDSIRMRDLIRDTISHQFLRNGVRYKFRIWDEDGEIYYYMDQGEKIILDNKVVILELTTWEKHRWWIKGLLYISMILFLIILFREFIKRLMKKIFP